MATELVAEEATTGKGRGFIDYIHLFRGAAIIQIVFLHVSALFLLRVIGQQSAEFPILWTSIAILFHDSTIYFALISGILYVHVYAKRGLKRFYRSRAANVIAPYIFLSVVLTLMRSTWPHAASAPDLSGWSDTLLLLGSNILTGKAWFHFWYMPIVIGLYAATPFIYACVSRRQYRWIAFLLMLLPFFISRNDIEVGLPTYFYFVGIYTLGMMAGLDLDRVLDFVQSRLAIFLALLAASTIGLICLYAMDITQLAFVSPRETVYFIQKTSAAALMLVGLRQWSRRPGPLRDAWLGAAASVAFALYFVHPIVALPLVTLARELLPAHPSLLLAMPVLLIVFAGTLLLCALLLAFSRRIFGRRSQLLVGA